MSIRKKGKLHLLFSKEELKTLTFEEFFKNSSVREDGTMEEGFALVSERPMVLIFHKGTEFNEIIVHGEYYSDEKGPIHDSIKEVASTVGFSSDTNFTNGKYTTRITVKFTAPSTENESMAKYIGDLDEYFNCLFEISKAMITNQYNRAFFALDQLDEFRNSSGYGS